MSLKPQFSQRLRGCLKLTQFCYDTASLHSLKTSRRSLLSSLLWFLVDRKDAFGVLEKWAGVTGFQHLHHQDLFDREIRGRPNYTHTNSHTEPHSLESVRSQDSHWSRNRCVKNVSLERVFEASSGSESQCSVTTGSSSAAAAANIQFLHLTGKVKWIRFHPAEYLGCRGGDGGAAYCLYKMWS